MSFIIRFVGTILTLLGAAYLIPGFHVESIYTALVVAIVLGVINCTLKPIVVFIALPLEILTLGLFTFVINAGFLLLIATFVKGFSIAGFIPAFEGALLIAVVLWILDRFF